MFQNAINLIIKSGELKGVPTSTLSVFTHQHQMSMQVNMFTNKPHISAIFHIIRQPWWKNIQWNE